MADTDTRLGKWHHLFFCLAPVDHMSVLRLRREKLHELSSKKTTKNPQNPKGPFDREKKKRFPQNVVRHSHLYDAQSVSLNLCFQPSESFLRLAKSNFRGKKNLLQKHSKALRKPDLVTTFLPKALAAWRVPRARDAPTSTGVKGLLKRPAYQLHRYRAVFKVRHIQQRSCARRFAAKPQTG